LNMLEMVLPATEKDDEEVLDWIIPDSGPKSRTAASPLEDTKSGKGEKQATVEHIVEEIAEEMTMPDKETWSEVVTRSRRKKQRKILATCEEEGCQDKCCNARATVGLFETISPIEEVNTIGEWEELMFAVDSGASETVVSPDSAKSIPTVMGAASKAGVKYATANGETVENEGEKTMVMCSIEGVNREITAQVTDINKPLLSVSKMCKAGYTTVFAPEGSYIVDGYTGEVMNLQEINGLFMLKGWIKSTSGFHRFGGNP